MNIKIIFPFLYFFFETTCNIYILYELNDYIENLISKLAFVLKASFKLCFLYTPVSITSKENILIYLFFQKLKITMFEGVVASLLNRYLGKYVEDLDLESLNVGIFSGNVVLENLKLKPEALVRNSTVSISIFIRYEVK